MFIFSKACLGFLTIIATATSLLVNLPGIASESLEQQLDIQPNNYTQGQSRDIADQLLRLGQQEIEENHYEAAIAAWYRAISIYIALGDFPSAGLAYDYIGNTYAELGRYPEAEDVFRRRLAIAQDETDFQGQIYGLNNLGNVLIQRGYWPQAQSAFQSALVIAQDIEDFAGIGLSFSNLGLVAKLQGNLIDAQTYYEVATEYRFRAEDWIGQAHSSNNLGQLYRQRGLSREALGAFLVARQAASEAGHIPTLLPALDGLIHVYSDRGDLAQVRQYLNERIAITGGSTSNPVQTLGTLIQLGDYYQQLGNPMAAQEAYQQALVLARQLGDIPREAFVLNQLQVVQFQEQE